MFRKNARSANLIINELINGQLMVINVQKNARSANLIINELINGQLMAINVQKERAKRKSKNHFHVQ